MAKVLSKAREKFRSGQDVKIRSGETENIDFAGMEARVIRDEEPRAGPDGKVSERVMVRPYLPDGRLGTPFDFRRECLGRPGETAVGRFVGKVVAVIRGGVYTRVGGKTQTRTPRDLPGGFATQ